MVAETVDWARCSGSAALRDALGVADRHEALELAERERGRAHVRTVVRPELGREDGRRVDLDDPLRARQG